MIALSPPLFQIGKLIATPGALDELERAGQHLWELVNRHVTGDWGAVEDEDKAANHEAVRTGARILGAYLLITGQPIWLITEAASEDGHRECTTALLPVEY